MKKNVFSLQKHKEGLKIKDISANENSGWQYFILGKIVKKVYADFRKEWLYDIEVITENGCRTIITFFENDKDYIIIA